MSVWLTAFCFGLAWVATRKGPAAVAPAPGPESAPAENFLLEEGFKAVEKRDPATVARAREALENLRAAGAPADFGAPVAIEVLRNPFLRALAGGEGREGRASVLAWRRAAGFLSAREKSAEKFFLWAFLWISLLAPAAFFGGNAFLRGLTETAYMAAVGVLWMEAILAGALKLADAGSFFTDVPVLLWRGPLLLFLLLAAATGRLAGRRERSARPAAAGREQVPASVYYEGVVNEGPKPSWLDRLLDRIVGY